MNLFWKKIPRTSILEQEMTNHHILYHAFVKTEKTALLEEYKELSTINFKSVKKEYKNKAEYNNSTMREKELRYQTLSKDSDIKNYLHYEKSNKLKFHENFTQSSFEEFSGKEIDSNKWDNSYKWSYDQMKRNYSNANEFQAYTEGENTAVIDGLLQISTKQKNTEGRCWDEKRGFIMKPYNYTSDVISSNTFTSDKGCVIIKFKLSGASKSLHHFIRAYDSKNQSCITLLESKSKRSFVVGRNIRGENNSDFSKITGINLEKNFLLLELEWNKEVISWRINGHLIYQKSNKVDMANMHLAIGSYLSNPNGNEGNIMIDYIRYFKER